MPFPASLPSSIGVGIDIDSNENQIPSTSGVPRPSYLNGCPKHPGRADQTPLSSEGPGPFIFPQPVIHNATFDVHEAPRFLVKSVLPVSSSETSLPREPGKGSSEGSFDSMSTTNMNDSSALDDSFGTLLSIAPSSMSATIPSSCESLEATGHDKEKGKARKPSGLSLSRPASIARSEVDGSKPLKKPSSSRSSSLESGFQADRGRPQLSAGHLPCEFEQPQSTRQSLLPSSQIGIDEGNTPTATPMGTPKGFPRPLPTSPTNGGPYTFGLCDRDIEKQIEGDVETPRAHVHGQGHVRWRSPLRVEQRGSERYSNLGFDDTMDGQWGSDASNETTPLLGSQSLVGPRRDLPSPTAKSDSYFSAFFPTTNARLRKQFTQIPCYGLMALKSLPAVLLGCLLNILDGVSCELCFLTFFPLSIFLCIFMAFDLFRSLAFLFDQSS